VPAVDEILRYHIAMQERLRHDRHDRRFGPQAEQASRVGSMAAGKRLLADIDYRLPSGGDHAQSVRGRDRVPTGE